MAHVPTVRIEHEGFPEGYVINESDFDPAVHRRFGEVKVCDSDGGTDAGPGMSNPHAGADVATEHQGGGWYRVKIDGAYLEGEDGTPATFKGEKAALDAAMRSYIDNLAL